MLRKYALLDKAEVQSHRWTFTLPATLEVGLAKGIDTDALETDDLHQDSAAFCRAKIENSKSASH